MKWYKSADHFITKNILGQGLTWRILKVQNGQKIIFSEKTTLKSDMHIATPRVSYPTFLAKTCESWKPIGLRTSGPEEIFIFFLEYSSHGSNMYDYKSCLWNGSHRWCIVWCINCHPIDITNWPQSTILCDNWWSWSYAHSYPCHGRLLPLCWWYR